MTNKHYMPAHRKAFVAYIRANPECSTREIADATGHPSRHIGAELDTLMRWGYLTCKMAERRRFWVATDKPLPARDPKTAAEVPLQIVTRSWQAPKIAGHWLDFALAGRAQVAA